MQENTKKYLKDLIDDLVIEANTINFSIYTLRKRVTKFRKFYDKVVSKL